MSKKARDKEPDQKPIAGGWIELALLIAAIVTVGYVALWFKLDVNRVFDVPKALALKVGGGGAFLAWLMFALFGRGMRWGSIKLFALPVLALTAAIIVSTLLSIDRATSIYGVYERQFGLQGFLGCVGLFVVTATCFASRRGALFGLMVLVVVAGVVGGYAALQASGLDPYGFFDKPHTKVYSTLGNATFAGNALALVAPLATILAITAATTTVHPARWGGSIAKGVTPLFAGFALALALQIGIGALAARSTMSGDEKQVLFKLGVVLSFAFILACGAFGTWGPESTRSQEEKRRFFWDAMGAGALAAMALEIFLGLLYTRTRGAWVGTGVAITLGVLLLPKLFNDRPETKRRMQLIGYPALGVGLLVAGLFIGTSSHLYAKTLRSIMAAFDPDRTDYGKGQGTRRYLWSESPRVLYAHGDTLERLYEDHDDYAERVTPMTLDSVEGIQVKEKLTESEKSFDSAWRKVSVWFFGIGIETYRYAFMSHKSKKLEAMDPMTNHDNPHNNYLYVLASFGIVGLSAYLWLLWTLLSRAFKSFLGIRQPEKKVMDTRSERAIAFGLVTSFFSYAFYSIAGFDSVACSVFFYFLLGSAAAFLEPSSDERPSPLLRSTPAAIGVAVLGVLLLGHTIRGGYIVHSAEQAFVGPHVRPHTALEQMERKIANYKKAIEINPNESFYKQSLGNAYADAARVLRSEAAQMQRQGNAQGVQDRLQKAQQYSQKAEVALYAALDHAWAPENIFISAFQVYYQDRRADLAEQALKRALEHSPHLGAVRSNLAILELERGGWDEAIRDCEWVLEVDKKSATSWRTCGRAYMMLGDLRKAGIYLRHAARVAPKDPVIIQYLDDLAKRGKEKTSTTSAPAP